MVLRHTFSDLFSQPKVSGKLSSFQTYNQGPFAFVPFQNVQNLSCPPQPDSAPSFSPSASSSLLDVIRSSRWPSEKAKSRAAGKNRDTWVSAPATPQSVLTYATNLSLHIKEKLSRASRDFSAVTAAITSKRPKKKEPSLCETVRASGKSHGRHFPPTEVQGEWENRCHGHHINEDKNENQEGNRRRVRLCTGVWMYALYRW